MKAGFALPSVLIVTGMTCLALLAAATAIEGLATSAREAAGGATFEERALDLEAGAVFAALTSPVTSSALQVSGQRGETTPVLLDGTAYAAGPDLHMALQDEAGLINLDTLPAADMPRLFRLFGVAGPRAGNLGAQLADYIDRDDLVRIGGAEAAGYRRAGRPAPPNRPLRARADLLGVLDWDEATPPSAWSDARDLIVTDAAQVGVNINTMPPGVLQVLYGLDPAGAGQAVAWRRNHPFASLGDLGRAGGTHLVGDAERSVTVPSGRLRLLVTSARQRRAYRSRIVLSPDDSRRPFRVEDRGAALLKVRKTGNAPADASAFPLYAD